MKRIEYFELFSNLSEFKSIFDCDGNEFVVFKQSNCNNLKDIRDKTGFEASENHIHLLNNIKSDEFDKLIPIAQNLGKALLSNLKYYFPQKHFMVFVSLHLHDSMIIRFHQKWESEEPSCNPTEFTNPKEKVFMFEG